MGINPFHIDDIAWVVAEKLAGAEFHVLEFGEERVIPGLTPGKDYRYSDLPLFGHTKHVRKKTLLVINTDPKPLPVKRYIKDRKGRVFFKFLDRWHRVGWLPEPLISLIEEGVWILTDIDNYPSRWYDAKETSQLFTPNMPWPAHIIDGRDDRHGGGLVYTYKLVPREIAERFPPERVRETV